jgi:hypothetical protein
MQDLTSEVLISTSVFIYIRECDDTKQSVTYPEKLMETAGTAVTILEFTRMMAEVTHLNSVEQHITGAIKNSTDFEWIRYAGCSLHHQ